MHAKESLNGPSGATRPWLTVCVITGLVVGAGGLAPSLIGHGVWQPSGTATSAGKADSPEMPPGPTPAAMLVRLAAGTVLVLALCAGTIPLLKRFVVNAPAAGTGGNLEVIASLQLYGRCHVSLVRAGGQHLLAGSDAGGLQMLVPVGDVPAESELPIARTPASRRAPANIEPRRLTAV